MKSVPLILTDLSLTLSNLTSALDSLPDTEWWGVGAGMNVPYSTMNNIRSQLSSYKWNKAEVLRVIYTEHPHLTWETCVRCSLQAGVGKISPCPREGAVPYSPLVSISLHHYSIALHVAIHD